MKSFTSGAAFFLSLCLAVSPAFAALPDLAPRFAQHTVVPDTDVTLDIPDGTYMATEENGDTYFYSFQYGESIPYVMFNINEMTGDQYYAAFDGMMKDKYADLEVTEEPHEVTVGGRRMVQFGYTYAVSGFACLDTRLYTEIDGKVYAFGSKEIPEIGYEIGDMLYEVAASLQVEGEIPETKGGNGGKDDIILPGGKTETEPEPTEDGTQEEPGSIEVSELVSYKTTPIVDADLGYTMARCYAPADYTVSNAVNVLNVGITTPVQIALSAVSPDGSVTLVYQSAQSFEDDEVTVGGQNFREEDGSQNLSMLTINLYKRDASGFCDLLVGSLLAEGVQAEVAAIAGPDEELKAVIDEESEKATAEAKELMSGLIGGGMFTTNTDMAVYFDFCEKTYSVMLPDEAGEETEYYILVDALTSYTESLVETNAGGFTGGLTVSSTNIYRTWGPKSVWLMLCPKESFEENEEIFRSFMANTRVSDEFLLWLDNLSLELVRIRQVIMEGGYGDYGQAVTDTAKEYLTGDTYSASDAWSDVIYDNNDYVTSDGSHVKMGTEYDYVYEDDKGNIYGTDTQFVPESWTQLTPTQIGE